MGVNDVTISIASLFSLNENKETPQKWGFVFGHNRRNYARNQQEFLSTNYFKLSIFTLNNKPHTSNAIDENNALQKV